MGFEVEKIIMVEDKGTLSDDVAADLFIKAMLRICDVTDRNQSEIRKEVVVLADKLRDKLIELVDTKTKC